MFTRLPGTGNHSCPSKLALFITTGGHRTTLKSTAFCPPHTDYVQGAACPTAAQLNHPIRGRTASFLLAATQTDLFCPTRSRHQPSFLSQAEEPPRSAVPHAHDT